MQEAVKGEFWRLRDDQGKPSSECLGKQCVNNSKERKAKDIVVPDIKWDLFILIKRFMVS
ncbi:hypothetical protein Ahy_A07g036458 isoform H [Arachis hypogaea]|uniref:Uncharacterized protein n=1 Tax=Arachis hypogaea TaxID=3818 RepID=A0A445CG71_ARAHY|nr:hypothetical protein Ahy_A07g036458 isoform H [Arachis hypogaea]